MPICSTTKVGLHFYRAVEASKYEYGASHKDFIQHIIDVEIATDRETIKLIQLPWLTYVLNGLRILSD